MKRRAADSHYSSNDNDSQHRHFGTHTQLYSSQHQFCFGREEVGIHTRECVIDRLNVMLLKERTIYDFDRCITSSTYDAMRRVKPGWRAQIAQWNYDIVDHWGFSRECVAVSMNLFDRYFAQENEESYKRNTILLVSCATLSIAIKMSEFESLSLATLSHFSRGKFTPTQIFHMERKVVISLDFYLTPPTVMSFAMHTLLLLPHGINERDKHELVEQVCFTVELSVADSFFVGNKPAPSIIAAAAIMISLRQCTVSESTLSTIQEIHYCDKILEQLEIESTDPKLKISQQRLELLLKNNKRKATHAM